jgi:DNA-binding GntR family transcriptional regulator
MAARVKAVSVVDAIAEDLRRAVLSGELPAGTPLTEGEVANRYDVARPTGKAAVEQLVHDGLLTRDNHRSARVVTLGPADVRDIYRTRAHLESEALRRLARTRAEVPAARAANAEIAGLVDGSALEVVGPDMRFHAALVDALGSPRTSRMYRSLVTEATMCMAQVQGRHLLETKLIVAEHQQLLDLVAAGDEAGAVALLEQHLGRARERLVGAIGGAPGPEA